LARPEDGRLALFGVNLSESLLYRSQKGVNVNDWSPWATSAQAGWYSLSAETAATSQIELMGLQRAQLI